MSALRIRHHLKIILSGLDWNEIEHNFAIEFVVLVLTARLSTKLAVLLTQFHCPVDQRAQCFQGSQSRTQSIHG